MFNNQYLTPKLSKKIQCMKTNITVANKLEKTTNNRTRDNKTKSIHDTSLLLISLGSSGSGLTSETTSPPGGNKTDLLTRWCVTTNGTGMTNMLMVTTTMGMLHWVHSHTTNLGPAVSLHTELVVSVTGLQHWLLGTSSTCNLTNHSTTSAWHNFLGSRWKLHPIWCRYQDYD
ncbi:hypothetical protein HanPSC8_Chr03g0113291 [Helianthus annuus]|nr:hypothetical protein HanPSC8_Chr03g0113291 [Helianthus annuus]